MHPKYYHRNTLTFIVAGVLAAAALPAQVAPSTEVGRREQRQQDRITNGVNSGEVTPAELDRLQKRSATLQDQIKNDRSANGGKLTPAEHRQINLELDALSDKIYRAKHNGRTAPVPRS